MAPRSPGWPLRFGPAASSVDGPQMQAHPLRGGGPHGGGGGTLNRAVTQAASQEQVARVVSSCALMSTGASPPATALATATAAKEAREAGSEACGRGWFPSA
jgi:hypothetical protein